MKDTCYFALSSPQGNDNYFSTLLRLKVDGKSFFRICQCAMICEDCRKLPMDEQIFCGHVTDQPHWLSSKKGARLKQLYKADPATAIKEFGGIVEDKFIPCFPKASLHSLFTQPTFQTTSAPEYIFTCVDPSGGGVSQLAICSGYYDTYKNYVVSFIYQNGPIQYSVFVASSNFSNISILLFSLNGCAFVFSTFGSNTLQQNCWN